MVAVPPLLERRVRVGDEGSRRSAAEPRRRTTSDRSNLMLLLPSALGLCVEPTLTLMRIQRRDVHQPRPALGGAFIFATYPDRSSEKPSRRFQRNVEHAS